MPDIPIRVIYPNRVYKHFKGKLYLVIDFAKHSETGEMMVVYRHLYGDYSLCVRPLSMFASVVDKQIYPDATQTYRFELVEDLSTISQGPMVVPFSPQPYVDVVWHSVDKELPNEGELVYITGPFLEGLYAYKNGQWYGQEDIVDNPENYWENVLGYDTSSIKWWRKKPSTPED